MTLNLKPRIGRRFSTVRAKLPVNLFLIGEKDAFEVPMVNISEGGLALAWPENFPPDVMEAGNILQVSFTCEELRDVKGTARVRWSETKGRDRLIGASWIDFHGDLKNIVKYATKKGVLRHLFEMPPASTDARFLKLFRKP